VAQSVLSMTTRRDVYASQRSWTTCFVYARRGRRNRRLARYWRVLPSLCVVHKHSQVFQSQQGQQCAPRRERRRTAHFLVDLSRPHQIPLCEHFSISFPVTHRLRYRTVHHFSYIDHMIKGQRMWKRQKIQIQNNTVINS